MTVFSRTDLLTIPNLLTGMRAIIAPLVVLALVTESFLSALLLLFLGGVSDFLDGLLARFLRQENPLGAYLDPIADKLLMLACYVGLPLTGLLPFWLAFLVVGRDLAIVGGVIMLTAFKVPITVAPVRVSKVATALQVATALYVLLPASLHFPQNEHIAGALFVATALLTLWSAGVYASLGWNALRSRPR